MLVAIAMFVSAAPVYGVTPSQSFMRSNQNADQGKKSRAVLTISPAKYPRNDRLFLEPGETYDDVVTITNDGDSAHEITLSAKPFTVNSEYKNLFDISTTRTRITEWTDFDEQKFTLDAGESKEVKFHVVVPDNAPPGGQYMGIAASTTQNSGGVQSTSEVTALFLATVNGEINESGSVVEHDISGWYANGKVSTSLTYQNDGNVDWYSRAELIVRDLSDNEICHSKPKRSLLMPDTEYIAEFECEESLSIGIYKFQHRFELFGNWYNYDKTVVVCPWWLVVFAILLLVGVGVLVVTLIRKKNRHSESGKPENLKISRSMRRRS